MYIYIIDIYNMNCIIYIEHYELVYPIGQIGPCTGHYIAFWPVHGLPHGLPMDYLQLFF